MTCMIRTSSAMKSQKDWRAQSADQPMTRRRAWSPTDTGKYYSAMLKSMAVSETPVIPAGLSRRRLEPHAIEDIVPIQYRRRQSRNEGVRSPSIYLAATPLSVIRTRLAGLMTTCRRHDALVAMKAIAISRRRQIGEISME